METPAAFPDDPQEETQMSSPPESPPSPFDSPPHVLSSLNAAVQKLPLQKPF